MVRCFSQSLVAVGISLKSTTANMGACPSKYYSSSKSGPIAVVNKARVRAAQR